MTEATVKFIARVPRLRVEIHCPYIISCEILKSSLVTKVRKQYAPLSRFIKRRNIICNTNFVSTLICLIGLSSANIDSKNDVIDMLAYVDA